MGVMFRWTAGDNWVTVSQDLTGDQVAALKGNPSVTLEMHGAENPLLKHLPPGTPEPAPQISPVMGAEAISAVPDPAVVPWQPPPPPEEPKKTLSLPPQPNFRDPRQNRRGR